MAVTHTIFSELAGKSPKSRGEMAVALMSAHEGAEGQRQRYHFLDFLLLQLPHQHTGLAALCKFSRRSTWL